MILKTKEELTRKGMGLGMVMLLLILRTSLMLIIKYQNSYFMKIKEKYGSCKLYCNIYIQSLKDFPFFTFFLSLADEDMEYLCF